MSFPKRWPMYWRTSSNASLATSRRIGPHIADQTDRTFFAELDAFVEPLRDHHGPLGGEAELARRLLLELTGDEGWNRVSLPLFGGNLGNLELEFFELGRYLASPVPRC